MFNTSLDILYLALAVSAIFLTIFLCIALYELIVSMAKINRVASAVEKIVIKSESLIDFIQDKVGYGSSILFGASEVIKNIISSFSKKKDKKTKSSKVKPKK